MKKGDGGNLALIAILAALTVGLGLAIWILPKRSFSEEENRTLTTWSSGDFRGIFSGEFSEKLNLFYTDQFPMRSTLTACRAYAELAQGKGENNGVLFGRDGYRIFRRDRLDTDATRRSLDRLLPLADAAKAQDTPALFCVVPGAVNVLDASLPPLYDATEANDSYAGLCAEIPDRLDLAPALREAADAGEQVFYRNDHHWTTGGAYLAYCEIMKRLGMTPLPKDYFAVEVASDDFSGTTAARSGLPAKIPDRIELYRYAGDTDFSVWNPESGSTQTGFYREDSACRGKYEIFLGGNFARLRITAENNENRPRLLLVKDSYANAVIPFLALHFDLEVIDPRYYRLPLAPLIVENAYDALLFLISADTLAEQS